MLVLSSEGKVQLIDSDVNHNYDKILKSDWLSTVLILALMGQCDRTGCAMPVIGQCHSTRALKQLSFTASKKNSQNLCSN